ncbi:MAG TPA: hypothetical protein VEA58_08915, partial [Anaerovoracaceae bacterium]|nr:hypothetical protein [Anaerovoracaceae bacterium]
MKLLHVCIIKADTCGGLLDGFDRWFRSPHSEDYSLFDPLCLVGPNGAGKSQFLQVLTEIFQSIYHTCLPGEERIDGNPDLQFEIEYLIQPEGEDTPVHVSISRQSVERRKPKLTIIKKNEDNWESCDPASPSTHKLLPHKVIGYTSGENETLSLPFLISRSGYAEEVGRKALSKGGQEEVADTRLMLIDYGTNLEVIVSNLLTNNGDQLEALIKDARLKDLHSFRCVIQLAHRAAPKLPGKKGIQLTAELKKYIDNLQRCATCYSYDAKEERYVFDFWVNEETQLAFNYFWQSTLELYSSLHKLS